MLVVFLQYVSDNVCEAESYVCVIFYGNVGEKKERSQQACSLEISIHFGWIVNGP